MKKRKLYVASFLCLSYLCCQGINRVYASHEENVPNITGEHSAFSDEKGGAVYNTINFEANDALFRNNSATIGGGALYYQNSTDTPSKIQNSSFANNKTTNADGYGGAIAIMQGNLAITNSKFNNNSSFKGGSIYNAGTTSVGGTFNSNSSVHGGAIYNIGNLTIENGSIFANNKANVEGSAIANYAENLIIGDNVQFKNNESFLNGYTYSGASEMGALYSEGNTSRTNKVTIGKNVLFEGNKAYGGSAIYLYGANDVTIGDGAKFINNVSQASADDTTLTSNGSAIKLASNGNGNVKVVMGKDAEFIGNKAKYAGAVYVSSEGDSFTVGDNAKFINNEASEYGGALINSGTTSISIGDGAKFEGNTSKTMGGAIVSGGTLNIGKNANFSKNIAATNAGGGIAIIPLDGRTTPTTKIDSGVTFDKNTAALGGGLYNGGNLEIGNNSTFSNNTATASVGGAIYNVNSAKIGDNSKFINNTAVSGGAVYNSNVLEIGKGATFQENKASQNGGAIYTTKAIQLQDVSFINNSAGSNGGAIYADDDVVFLAVDKDVVFSGNTAALSGLSRSASSNSNDIYMNKDNSTLTMNASEGRTIAINDGISGQNYQMAVNTGSSDKGKLVLSSAIENAKISVENGTFAIRQGGNIDSSTLTVKSGATLDTVDGNITEYGNNVTLNNNTSIIVDIDMQEGKSDNFENSNVAGNVTLAGLNSVNADKITSSNISIDLAKALGINGLSVDDSLKNTKQTILTPIRYLSGSVDSAGVLNYAPTGNSYNDFNPAIMTSTVAAQLGGYLAQINSYDEAFRNMDMYMTMTQTQRQSLKNANKYASNQYKLPFIPLDTPYESTAGWFRPYTSYEHVKLNHGGPNVANFAYGSFAGLDSGMHEFANGWDGMFSVYAGYNGSRQQYQGNSIMQNGGTFGITGTLYKGGFFTGLTANIGGNIANSTTIYGNDDFSMLMTGVASKSGYNIEVADGKFIIQPSYLISYSLVNTFDYTNSQGIRITSDPLNAIQMEPGLKFILNLDNGWQPYAGVSVVWNIIDQTKFKANDSSLPNLSVKPFVKYGVGVRKTWGERLTGFFQSFVTGGGRNGVGVQAGCRIRVGKKN